MTALWRLLPRRVRSAIWCIYDLRPSERRRRRALRVYYEVMGRREVGR